MLVTINNKRFNIFQVTEVRTHNTGEIEIFMVDGATIPLYDAEAAYFLEQWDSQASILHKDTTTKTEKPAADVEEQIASKFDMLGLTGNREFNLGTDE